MRSLLAYWFLRLERAMHLADAYLADCRGDGVFRADCLSRAYECERRIAVLEINYVQR